MIRRSRPSQRRSAFTLVELLVVILIISILSALLTVAVSRGISVAKRTRNATEIRQLAAAVDAFKAKYKVDFIPSQLFLSETLAGYTQSPNSTLVQGSLAYLQRIWPRLNFQTVVNGKQGIDWNGSGSIEGPGSMGDTFKNPSGQVILQGDQVLVFLLGGIPRFTDAPAGQLDTLPPNSPFRNVVSVTGFSKSPSNPAAHLLANANGTPLTQAEPPLYEFDASRLVNLHNGSVRMLSYLDTYGAGDGMGNWVSGMPYLYFSSYQTRNGYNLAFSSQSLSTDCRFQSPPNATPRFPNFIVWPYAQGANQYLNPTGFQIISAGADLTFGPGTSNPIPGGGPFWTPATAASSGASAGNGADDQSNFYDTLLGTPSIN